LNFKLESFPYNGYCSSLLLLLAVPFLIIVDAEPFGYIR
jgi:hypothetical protein